MVLQGIKEKIEQSLPGSKVEIIDESEDHAGHDAHGAHIALKVTYKGFADKAKIEQHRIIYDILKDEFVEKIHALALKTEVE